jgi:HTH-type transcriptional regulator/antitoxin HigA
MTINPIKTERDYQKALKEIEKLWDAKPNTAKGDRLEVQSHWSRLMSKNTTGSILPIRSKPSSFAWNSLNLSHPTWRIFLGAGRKLTVEMMRSLRKRLGIPADSLLA